MVPRLTRRAVVGAAPFAFSACATAQLPPHAADPLSGAALFADVERYAAFPEHRTATAGDVARSRWIADGLREAGYAVRLLPFTIDRYDLRAHRLVVGDFAFPEFDAYPLWTPVNTPAGGVVGRLAAQGQARGQIASVVTDGLADLGLLPRTLDSARAEGAAAAIVLTVTPSGEVFGHGLREGPNLPVMLVGAKHRARLEEALRVGAPVRLDIDTTMTPNAEAFEVEGTRNAGAKRIVISTPTSAWFASAGERGPGVALFLGLARWAARTPLRHSLTFIASSGHELYGVGKKTYLDADAPTPAETTAWIHLGASIAVYEFAPGPVGLVSTRQRQSGTRLLTNDQAFLTILQRSFAGLAPLTPRMAQGARGELGLMFDAGYRALGFEGAHAYLHGPNDLPFVTGPDILGPVGEALAQTITALDQGQSE